MDAQRHIQLQEEREEPDTDNLNFLLDRDIREALEAEKKTDFLELWREKFINKFENLI